MKAIRPIIREFALLYFKRALAEICPTHRDVPYIVHRINDLTRERGSNV